VVSLFIIAGIGYVNKSNIGIWAVSAGTPGCAEFMPFGFGGVVTGAAVIFFAYIGFDAVSTAAQEAKNPTRDMPIGILGSLAICTVLYVLVAGIMVGLVDYRMLTNAAAPIAVAVDEALKMAQGTTMGTILKVFPTIIKVGAVLGLSSTMVVMVMGQPRVFYSMSKDGLLPTWAAKVHPTLPDAAHYDRDHRDDRCGACPGWFRSACWVSWSASEPSSPLSLSVPESSFCAGPIRGCTVHSRCPSHLIVPVLTGHLGSLPDEQPASRYLDPADRLDVLSVWFSILPTATSTAS
jgi:hypothetical protein